MRGEKYLTKSEQYASILSKGNAWVNSLLVMRVLPNELTLSRYGFSVSRRVGNAVVRNRVKRLLREILRVTSLKPGRDIVFVARPAAGSGDYAALKKSVESLLSRAQLLAREYERVRFKTN